MTEFSLNSFQTGNQWDVSLAALGGGGFVAAWTSEGQDGADGGIYGRRFDATGRAQGAEFRLNLTTADDQSRPEIIGLSNGGFVAVWQSNGQDGSGSGVYARVFAANGTPTSGEIQIAQTTSGEQIQPRVTELSNGGFAVAWASQDTAMYRLFNANGAPTTAEIALPGTNAGSIDIDANGMPGATVMYRSYDANTGTYTRHLVTVDNNGTITGSQGAVVGWRAFSELELTPSGRAVTVDFHQAFAHCLFWHPVSNVTVADTNGAPGNEANLSGASGVETYAAVASISANRVLVAFTARDALYYGLEMPDHPMQGIQYRLFDISGGNLVPVGGPINVNTYHMNTQTLPDVTVLANGNFVIGWQSQGQDSSGLGVMGRIYDANGNPVSAGPAATPLSGGGGDDTLTGNSQRDLLTGRGGDDLLRGMGGTDTLRGGNGDDRLSGGGAADILHGQRGNYTLNGSSGDDLVQGGYGHDRLLGGSGHDRLFAGGGNDRLLGGTGNDVLRGASGADRLWGGRGHDWLNGGTGNDRLSGQRGSDVLRGGAGQDSLSGGSGGDTL